MYHKFEVRSGILLRYRYGRARAERQDHLNLPYVFSAQASVVASIKLCQPCCWPPREVVSSHYAFEPGRYTSMGTQCS